MFKLLTRRDLWIAVAFSAIFWFGLRLIGASAKFSQAFGGLVLLLSVLTLALAESDRPEEIEATTSQEDDEEGESLYSVLAAQNEAQKKIQAELAAIREDLKSVKSASGPAARENVTNEVPEKLGELSGALSEAMKQISSRDGQIDLLAKNVNQSNIQRNLVRLTQTLEFSLSLHKRIVAGESDPAESMQFIVDDLESALAANGVEHMVILPGTKIPELKAGSFIPVTVVEAASPELKGTVKEVRTRAYFINEESRPRFISPAKVVLYKA